MRSDYAQASGFVPDTTGRVFMATGKTKTYKVDFFVATHDRDRNHSHVLDVLASASPTAHGAYTKALSLAGDPDEKFQIRSLVASKNGKVFMGVFGRCQYNEVPQQGAEDGRESDLVPKPGHGLVNKNHFLFYPERNLLVWQRNGSASHHTRFQNYISRVTREAISLEPILTQDSYQRLIDGGHARVIECSFQLPKDPSLYPAEWTRKMLKLLQESGGVNSHIRISVGRTSNTLLDKMKEVVVSFARGGFAKVARVQLEEDQNPIDLIADRVIDSMTVKLGQNSRPDPKDLYAGLENAFSNQRSALRTFYGR